MTVSPTATAAGDEVDPNRERERDSALMAGRGPSQRHTTSLQAASVRVCVCVCGWVVGQWDYRDFEP